MSAHIDAAGRLVHERQATLALNCPHCQVLAHITPIAVPSFEEINEHRPKAVGVVFRCDSCFQPIFLRFPVKMFGPNRVELSSQFTEVERLEEKFSYSHLPEDVATLFRETLACYSGANFNAFATMCRRTMRAVLATMNDAGRAWVTSQLEEARKLAEIDEHRFAETRQILLGSDLDPSANLPFIDAERSGVLVEVIKDLLYQVFVRKSRLQQSISVRRYFFDEKMLAG